MSDFPFAYRLVLLDKAEKYPEILFPIISIEIINWDIY